MIEWISTLPVLMIFNRIRGGGMSGVTDRLPGRALYYVSAIVGGLTASFFSLQLGVIIGLGFLIWAAPGWGLWFALNKTGDNKNDPRWNDWFVKLIWTISFKSNYIALFWRMSIMLLPMLATYAFWYSVWWIPALALPFGIAVVGAYHIGVNSSMSITLAELLTGAIWWLLILILGGI